MSVMETSIELITRFKWWLSDSFIGVVAQAVALTAVILGIMIGGFYMVSRYECSSKGELMGLQTDFGLYTGCMINIKGQWLPWTSVVPVERDGKILFVPKPEVYISK